MAFSSCGPGLLLSDSDGDEDDTGIHFKRRRKTLEDTVPTNPCSPVTIRPVLSAICIVDTDTEVDLSDPKVLRRQNKPIIEVPKTKRNQAASGSDEADQATRASKLINDPFETIKEHKIVLPYVSRPRTSLLNSGNRNGVCHAADGIFQKPLVKQAASEDIRRLDDSYAELEDEKIKERVVLQKHATRAKYEDSQKVPAAAKPRTPIETPREIIMYDFSKEECKVAETVKWILQDEQPASLDISLLTSWRKTGLRNENPTHTCFFSKHIYDQLIRTRETLTSWDKNSLLSARCRSNPFETLRSAFFMNRAALKIANIDAILEFSLTVPKTAAGRPMLRDTELFYFADVCAGPGGFSEYVLWRNGWEAKGFGFTLRHRDFDFNLSEFLAGTPESFDVNYGVNGDGNVLDPANVSSFILHVLENTDGSGVHLMMADGGIEVEDKGMEEEAAKGLYLAQFLVALGIVREGGNFVCKLFDITTPFSVGLVYLICQAFEKVGIHKPLSSRPANPERYIICKWKRSNTSSIFKYLTHCHEMLWSYSKSKKPGCVPLDILELVPLDLAKKNTNFFKYLIESNDAIATSQILALQKMALYYMDSSLNEIRQAECRKACLALWSIPDDKRAEYAVLNRASDSADERFDIFREEYKHSMLSSKPTILTRNIIKKVFRSPFDWRFVVLGSGPVAKSRGFYYGMGGQDVRRYEDNLWKSIPYSVTLPKDTFVYAELVTELTINQKDGVVGFHIIDGFLLGGKDIRNMHYVERHEMCVKFAKAINKPGYGGAEDTDISPIRAKLLTRMEHIGTIFEKIISPETDDEESPLPASRLFTINESSSNPVNFFCPFALLFLKITKDPWLMEFDRETGRKFWFNTETKISSFNCPVSSIADFKETTEQRLLWIWEKDTFDVIKRYLDDPSASLTDKVYPKHLIDHVENFLAHVKPPPRLNPPQQLQNHPVHVSDSSEQDSSAED